MLLDSGNSEYLSTLKTKGFAYHKYELGLFTHLQPHQAVLPYNQIQLLANISE